MYLKQMDLLKTMMANRKAQGADLVDPEPRNGKKKTKMQKAKEYTSGSREMRNFIIKEKPSKKVVIEHFETIIAQECESSSDED